MSEVTVIGWRKIKAPDPDWVEYHKRFQDHTLKVWRSRYGAFNGVIVDDNGKRLRLDLSAAKTIHEAKTMVEEKLTTHR